MEVNMRANFWSGSCVVGAMLVCLAAGCGRGSNDIDKAKLVGTWERTSLSGEYEGKQVPVRDSDYGPIVFRITDSTIKRVKFEGVSLDGICFTEQAYTLQGNEIHAQQTQSSDQVCQEFTFVVSDLSDTTATIRAPQGGGNLVMGFSKIDESRIRALGKKWKARSIK